VLATPIYIQFLLHYKTFANKNIEYSFNVKLFEQFLNGDRPEEEKVITCTRTHAHAHTHMHIHTQHIRTQVGADPRGALGIHS